MQRMVEAIQQIARHEVTRRRHTALGVVRSLHGNDGTGDYAVTVELRETGIVLPRVPILAGVIGSVSLPREEDLVLVAFVDGDLHAPIVVGRLHHPDVPPPEHGPGEWVVQLPGDEASAEKRLELRVVTPGDGTRRVHLLLDGSPRIELEVTDESIALKAQDAQLELTQSGSSDGKARLVVGDSSVTIEQSGDVSVKAAGKLSLSAQQVEISGDVSVKVQGQTIDLN